ncbi:MAG: efflux RND transporter periplasmic adaptor subunit [Thermoguttaceae bacterium]
MRTLLLCVTVLILFCGCKKTVSESPPELPLVVVESVQVRDVPVYVYASGVAEPRETVRIPARVDGVLQEVLYSPGEYVAASEPLFVIEPTQYQMETQIAEADLDAAKAQLALCEANLARSQSLLDKNAISGEEWQTSAANKNQAAAEVTRREALLTDAKLKLGYTQVRSPIRGKTDRNTVDVGNFVGPTTANPVLTTVVGVNPIYITFAVSDADYPKIRDTAPNDLQRQDRDAIIEKIRQGWSTAHTGDAVPEVAPLPDANATTRPAGGGASWDFPTMTLFFEMGIIEGTAQPTDRYPWRGLVELSANKISQTTGTITHRGVIPNEDHAIVPGQVCRVRVPVTPLKNAILIKQEAVCQDFNRDYVYVVDDNNIASKRRIETGLHQEDGTVVVTKGLEPHDRYVVQGTQRVTGGGKIRVQTP